MAFNYSPNIVRDSSLVLYLDAANTKSYVSGSTIWNDISRGGNNGTLTNGPTFNTGSGGSIVFDGVDDYVRCTNNSLLNSITTDYTVCSWFNLPNVTAGVPNNDYNPIFSRHDPNSGNSDIEIYGGNNGFTLVHNRGGNFGGAITYNYPLSNIIQYYVITFTNLAWNIYVNGVFKENMASWQYGPPVNPNITSGYVTDIGQFYTGYTLTGKIYSTVVYNRALTSTEVTQNFNATKTRFGL